MTEFVLEAKKLEVTNCDFKFGDSAGADGAVNPADLRAEGDARRGPPEALRRCDQSI